MTRSLSALLVSHLGLLSFSLAQIHPPPISKQDHAHFKQDHAHFTKTGGPLSKPSRPATAPLHSHARPTGGGGKGSIVTPSKTKTGSPLSRGPPPGGHGAPLDAAASHAGVSAAAGRVAERPHATASGLVSGWTDMVPGTSARGPYRGGDAGNAPAALAAAAASRGGRSPLPARGNSTEGLPTGWTEPAPGDDGPPEMTDAVIFRGNSPRSQGAPACALVDSHDVMEVPVGGLVHFNLTVKCPGVSAPLNDTFEGVRAEVLEWDGLLHDEWEIGMGRDNETPVLLKELVEESMPPMLEFYNLHWSPSRHKSGMFQVTGKIEGYDRINVYHPPTKRTYWVPAAGRFTVSLSYDLLAISVTVAVLPSQPTVNLTGWHGWGYNYSKALEPAIDQGMYRLETHDDDEDLQEIRVGDLFTRELRIVRKGNDSSKEDWVETEENPLVDIIPRAIWVANAVTAGHFSNRTLNRFNWLHDPFIGPKMGFLVEEKRSEKRVAGGLLIGRRFQWRPTPDEAGSQMAICFVVHDPYNLYAPGTTMFYESNPLPDDTATLPPSLLPPTSPFTLRSRAPEYAQCVNVRVKHPEQFQAFLSQRSKGNEA
ncbi:unnamed protein product [Vitrella brassicaformis CCMP3155]|uniref:Uncharacterized protein n=1 Tax=Vitrella brassicaformis (strain CCMP3155) TaxID=1169540 RepID=A0A0G4ERS6_VITBC|nr:unnamed protein product [Vitrella brassicaformis CCMP3155]|eukprot:CEM00560.1 unnamed protein product [Vitrella brassicaformis CCMP3155]